MFNVNIKTTVKTSNQIVLELQQFSIKYELKGVAITNSLCVSKPWYNSAKFNSFKIF